MATGHFQAKLSWWCGCCGTNDFPSIGAGRVLGVISSDGPWFGVIEWDPSFFFGGVIKETRRKEAPKMDKPLKWIKSLKWINFCEVFWCKPLKWIKSPPLKCGNVGHFEWFPENNCAIWWVGVIWWPRWQGLFVDVCWWVWRTHPPLGEVLDGLGLGGCFFGRSRVDVERWRVIKRWVRLGYFFLLKVDSIIATLGTS